MAKIIKSEFLSALVLALGQTSNTFADHEPEDDTDAAQVSAANAANMAPILNAGLAILNEHAPLELSAVITLVAGTRTYSAPDNTLDVISHDWGREQMRTFKCWDPNYPKNIPNVKVHSEGDGEKFVLSHPPSYGQLSSLGNFMQVNGLFTWQLEDDVSATNIPKKHQPWLLKACEAAAMRMLMVGRAGNPLKHSQAKNINPGAVYEVLINEIKQWAQ